MGRWRVPVTVTTTHYVDVDVPDDLDPAVSAWAAHAAARRMTAAEVRRTLPYGTTRIVGAPQELPPDEATTETSPVAGTA